MAALGRVTLNRGGRNSRFDCIKFGDILSICSQAIERKQNFGTNQGP